MEKDFTNLQINPLKIYGGKNGNKIGIIYQNENYMLKFPPKPTKNPDMSYANCCISEYVACHIFETVGFETQKTMLGRYNNKITVACKDFEVGGYALKDFAYLKNSIIDSEQNGYGTELSDILATIKSQRLMPPKTLEKYFWEMFIVDALLGNFDRHNGNWGFLINSETNNVKIAPVFDCGSCLYPQLDEKKMRYVLENESEINERVFAFPTSAVHHDGKKINYAQFLATADNKECISALKTVTEKIDLIKINEIIDNTPFISDLQKQFFKTMTQARKEKILDAALLNIECAEAVKEGKQCSRADSWSVRPRKQTATKASEGINENILEHE